MEISAIKRSGGPTVQVQLSPTVVLETDGRTLWINGPTHCIGRICPTSWEIFGKEGRRGWSGVAKFPRALGPKDWENFALKIAQVTGCLITGAAPPWIKGQLLPPEVPGLPTAGPAWWEKKGKQPRRFKQEPLSYDLPEVHDNGKRRRGFGDGKRSDSY